VAWQLLGFLVGAKKLGLWLVQTGLILPFLGYITDYIQDLQVRRAAATTLMLNSHTCQS
jgi:hypothetical protein